MPNRAPFKPGILDQLVGVALVGVQEQIESWDATIRINVPHVQLAPSKCPSATKLT